jgi:hypothetical protein
VSSSSRSSNSPPSSRRRPMSSSRYSSNSSTGAGEARPRWIGCSRWRPCAGKPSILVLAYWWPRHPLYVRDCTCRLCSDAEFIHNVWQRCLGNRR